MLFAFFPFLFLFLPILVWLWKLTSGEDKVLLGASLLFGACQGLEALLPGGLLEPRLLLPLLAVCAVSEQIFGYAAAFSALYTLAVL